MQPGVAVTETCNKCMATNEGVTNRSAVDGTFIAGADPPYILDPPTGGGYLCLNSISTYYIFSTTYDSITTDEN